MEAQHTQPQKSIRNILVDCLSLRNALPATSLHRCLIGMKHSTLRFLLYKGGKNRHLWRLFSFKTEYIYKFFKPGRKSCKYTKAKKMFTVIKICTCQSYISLITKPFKYCPTCRFIFLCYLHDTLNITRFECRHIYVKWKYFWNGTSPFSNNICFVYL